MIFANHLVAKKISQAFPHQSLLRCHPSPRSEAFEELKRCAASKGWDIDVWSNKALANSLDACIDKNDPNVNMLLRSLATQAMEQAIYFSTGGKPADEWEHYGLALHHYTHFTSPIRRYADVIVHRLLLSALDEQDWWSDSDEKRDVQVPRLTNSQLNEVCEHINEKNKAAQLAQRQSQLLFQTLFFRNKDVDDPRCIVEAVVFGIRANGFIVYVPTYALKGPVYLQDKGGDKVLYIHKRHGPMWIEGDLSIDEHAIHVIPADGKRQQSYRLFNHVTVTIQLSECTDAHARSLAYYLLAKRPPPKAEDNNAQRSVGTKTDELKISMNFLQEIKKDRQRQRDENAEECKDSEIEIKVPRNRKFHCIDFLKI